MIARTQKARGVQYLASRGYNVPDYYVVNDEQQLQPHYYFPAFARPCPAVPRHGFVESQIVCNVMEALRVFRDAIAADPQAEMILMKPINAAQSAIVTRNIITIGMGNDGATSGKDGTITLPLAGVDMTWTHHARLQGSPFVEVVQSNHGTTYYVQLRDGPTIEHANGNWIPQDTTVTNVLTAQGDLLEWETAIKNARAGTIVHAPSGNMLSHYSVHAVLSRVPIVFDACAPAIGTHLPATTASHEIDFQSVITGAIYGFDHGVQYDVTDRIVSALLLGTHQSSALRQSMHGCVLVGIAAAWLCRVGTAACLGEHRYYNDRRTTRQDVYINSFHDYYASRQKLRRAWKTFQFTEKPSSGVGGQPWAACTQATMQLDRAITRLSERPNSRHADELIAQLNLVVNLAHNNGWWLNKFTTTSVMDLHASGHMETIVDASLFVAPHVRKALQGNNATLRIPHLAVPATRKTFQVCLFNGNALSIQLLHATVGKEFTFYDLTEAEVASLKTLLPHAHKRRSIRGTARTYSVLTKGMLMVLPETLRNKITGESKHE